MEVSGGLRTVQVVRDEQAGRPLSVLTRRLVRTRRWGNKLRGPASGVLVQRVYVIHLGGSIW